MEFMFFAGHFACSVICVLGGRVSLQKGYIIEILDAMGRRLCEPRAPSVMVLCPNQVKFMGCAGKIMATFSNAAGQQYHEVHGCGISIINVLVLL